MAFTNDHQQRIGTLLTQIKEFYRHHAPIVLTQTWQQLVVATPAELTAFEALIGEPLPEDYRQFLLQNDLQHSFDGNFACLDIRAVARRWRSMTTALDAGIFDDGRIAYHKAKDFGNWDNGVLTECWWSRGWIPVAEDGCGNLKCIDCRPGPNGVVYQIMAMEVQDGQGPFSTSYTSFTHYLTMHLTYLKNGQFRLSDDGLEVDRYLQPRPLADS